MHHVPGKVLILLCKDDDLLKSAKNLNRSSSLSLSPSYQEKHKNQSFVTMLHTNGEMFRSVPCPWGIQSKWVTIYLTAVILCSHTNITRSFPQHNSYYID